MVVLGSPCSPFLIRMLRSRRFLCSKLPSCNTLDTFLSHIPTQFTPVSKVVHSLPDDIQEELSERHGGLLNYVRSNKEWVKLRFNNSIPEIRLRGDVRIATEAPHKRRLRLHIPSFGIPLIVAAKMNSVAVSKITQLALEDSEGVMLVDNPAIYTAPSKPTSEEFVNQLYIKAGSNISTSAADALASDVAPPPQTYNICRLARYLSCEAFMPISEVVSHCGILTEPLLPILLTPRFEIQSKSLPDNVKEIIGSDVAHVVKRISGARFKCKPDKLRPDLRQDDVKALLSEIDDVKEKLRVGTLHFLKGKDKRQALMKKLFHTKYPLGTPFLDDDVLHHAIFDLLEDQKANVHVAFIRDRLSKQYGDALPVFKDTFFFEAPDLLSAQELNKGGVVVGRTDVVGFKEKEKELSSKEIVLEMLSCIKIFEGSEDDVLVNTSNLMVNFSKYTRKQINGRFGSLHALLLKFPDVFETRQKGVDEEVIVFTTTATKISNLAAGLLSGAISIP